MVSQPKSSTKILIVDDNDSMRMVMRDLIEFFSPDCEVVEAHNGQVGVETAQAIQPDLIFFDFHMPVMNGYEMALALQAQPRTRRIPLILNTSDTSNNPALTYLKRICSAALHKPFQSEEFEETLRKFMPTYSLMSMNVSMS